MPFELGGTDFGTISINTSGNLTMGLGSGLAMDMSDGSLGVGIGPVVVDTSEASDTPASTAGRPSYDGPMGPPARSQTGSVATAGLGPMDVIGAVINAVKSVFC